MNKSLPWIYLLLAILGAILPWQANLEFMQMNPGGGFDLQTLSKMPISMQPPAL